MIKSVWKFINNIAISHKRSMLQAEIIDTFWMYQGVDPPDWGRSNASLLPFLRMFLHGFVSLCSMLRCVSDFSADLSPGSCGPSSMFMCILFLDYDHGGIHTRIACIL